MTLTEAPPTRARARDAEALFKEARRRRRRRWAIGTAAVLAAASIVTFLLRPSSRAPRAQRPLHGGLERWTPPKGGSHPAPAFYVAGDGQGGVGLYSTSTGVLTRSLSSQTSGGPDSDVMLSADRRWIFFSQATGTCTANILRVPISGTGSPDVVVSVPQTLAISPTSSPTSNELAWLGVACGAAGSYGSPTLYVTDMSTGVRDDLGTVSGQSGDDAIAWNHAGTQLAVEDGNTIELFDATSGTLTESGDLGVAANCRLSSPSFLAQRFEVGVIRTCFSGKTAGSVTQVLAFNTKTGRPVSVIATAPIGAVFQGLSVDASGTDVLLGFVPRSASSAELVRLDGRRKVVVSRHAITDAEW